MFSKTFILAILCLFVTSTQSANFENVTLLLSTQLRKLFLYGSPPIDKIYIKSADTLSEYINNQPLEVAVIQNATIPLLPKGSISNLPNLIHLSILSSKVEGVKPGAFSNIPKLEGLNLGGNLLEEIPNGVFSDLSIQILYLNDNQISRIESEAFNNMTLNFISLSNNRISKWDSKWFMGSPVASIYIENNFLEEIPENAFEYSLQFKQVNVPLILGYYVFSNNHIKHIHKDAFKHINGFGYLNFDKNKLKGLSKNIFQTVRYITALHLDNNDISNVDGVFNDINIHQLVLSNNSLNCFPKEVFDVSKIYNIYLDGNKFSCSCVEEWKHFLVHNPYVMIKMDAVGCKEKKL